MTLRPIDIAKRLGISTTTLRHYQDSKMIPPVMRSATGYRIYTDEHIAYFICIREMMQGFTLSEIADMLKLVIENKHDEALWTANKALASLQNDRYVCEQLRQRFLQKKNTALKEQTAALKERTAAPKEKINDMKEKFAVSQEIITVSKERLAVPKVTVNPEEFSIDVINKATGVTPSTIRYWDKIGLISASRCAVNNYRTFTQAHIDEILMIQALKLAMRARGEKYAVEQIRRELHEINFNDSEKIAAIVLSIEKHLAALNRAMVRSVYALCSLCTQIEENCYNV